VEPDEKIIATLSVPEVSDKDGERIGLAKSKIDDEELRPIIELLKDGRWEDRQRIDVKQETVCVT